VDISFKDFDTRYATPLTTGVDFETLCAALSAAQAASVTVKLTQSGGHRVRRPLRPVQEAVIFFRREDGWEDAVTAMRGSFHADAAACLPLYCSKES